MRNILRLTIETDDHARDVNPNDGDDWKLHTFDRHRITSVDRDRFDPDEDTDLAAQLADGSAFFCHEHGDTWHTADTKHANADGIVVWEGDRDNLPDTDDRETSADGFLSVYSEWARGEVYGYTLTDYRTGDEPGGHACCWGFIGDHGLTVGVLEYQRRELTAPNTFVVIDGEQEYAIDRKAFAKAGVRIISQAEADRMAEEDERAATMEALLV